MATLTINRSSEYANRLRDIALWLNNEKIGTVGNGKSVDFEIPAGSHTLQAKIDWCTSNEVSFQVPDKGSRQFQLTSFAKHSRFGIWATIYYITLGAKKYLRLEEVQQDKNN